MTVAPSMVLASCHAWHSHLIMRVDTTLPEAPRAARCFLCVWFDQGMGQNLHRGLTVMLIAIALLFGFPVAAAAYEARSPGYQCAISHLIPNAAVLERGASGTFSVWPLGLECRYLDANGSPLIVSPGWFLSGLGIGSLTSLLALATLTVIALVRSPQSPGRRLHITTTQTVPQKVPLAGMEPGVLRDDVRRPQTTGGDR